MMRERRLTRVDNLGLPICVNPYQLNPIGNISQPRVQVRVIGIIMSIRIVPINLASAGYHDWVLSSLP
jgi:hypothetical protein